MTNTYNTGNPIGSTDPRDLYDNASNFDEGMNRSGPTFTDRLGNLRKTWNGMETEFDLAQAGREAEFQQFLVDSGFVSLGNYAAGLNFTAYNQYTAREGFFYRAAPSSIPFITTGTWAGADENLFVLLDPDDVLRQDLANDTDPAKGAALVAFDPGTPYTPQSVGAALRAFVSVDWFGAVSDGVADDTAAIRAAIAHAEGVGVGVVYLGKSHRISETITIPVGLTLEGQGRNCKIIPTVGGTYSDGFLFLINSTDGLNGTVPFPNTMSGGLRKVNFWNGDVAGTPTVAPLRGVRGFGSCVISQIRGRNMTQMVSRPSGGIYSDSFDVDDIYCEPVIGAEYQVDIRGLGDGLRVGKLHFPYNAINPGTGTPLGLYVGGTYGGRIGECVGGDVFITRSKVVIDCGHHERSRITIDGANVDIRSTYISASNRLPLVLSNNTGQECVVTLDACEFSYLAGLQEWQGSDISLATGVTLEVRNSYRRYTKTGALDKSQQHGLTLETDTATPITAWNSYSYALSRQGRVYRGRVVDQTFSVAPRSASFIGVNSAAVDSTEPWGAASGTYYYHAQYLVDTTRLIGRTGTAGEQAVVLTNGGSGARLTVDFNGKPTSAILRFYRGTVAGSYSHFVDVPVFSARLFYDSGAALNGYPWQSRAAGPIDTINGIGEAGVEFSGGSVVVRAATTPTVGTWSAGDDIYRIAPAAAGKRAWTCTTAGAPGTWKAWGVIDA